MDAFFVELGENSGVRSATHDQQRGEVTDG
jgi:hypothetical protein